jgi:hypothetical protein
MAFDIYHIPNTADVRIMGRLPLKLIRSSVIIFSISLGRYDIMEKSISCMDELMRVAITKSSITNGKRAVKR